jgi:hypothetical protein
LSFYTRMWAEQLAMERTIGVKTRMSMSFGDISTFGEVLCAILSGMYGNGGSGSGHDLSNGTEASEVKTVCWCQPWGCKGCPKKTPWTSTSCVHCGSTELKRVKDSRAGISASAHITHASVLKSYHIVLIDHVDGNNYQVSVWKISSENAYFDNYVRTQASDGASTCNMIPRSYDFHMSGPKLLCNIDINLDTNTQTWKITMCDKVEDVPVCILRPEEKRHFPELTMVPYEVACEKLSLRKKSHGKPRGGTTRHL